MKRFSLSLPAIITLAVTFLFSISSWAEQDSERLELSQTLVNTSGFNGLLQQLPLHFERGVKDASSFEKTENSEQQQLLIKAEQALNAAQIRQQITAAVARALTKKEIATLLQWYNSAAGKRISTAQTQASSEAGFEAMLFHVNTLLAEEDLLQLATVLDKQLGFVEFIVDLQEFQAFAEYSTISILRQQTLDVDAFDEKMKKEREHMVFNAEQLVMLSLAYAFRDIQKKDILAYEHFLQQPLTQLFLKAAMRGLEVGKQNMVRTWLQQSNRQIASE